MKIYTEADLKKVISIYSEEYKTSTDEILKELNLTPIELPSDEEIEEEANKKYQEQQQSYENSVEMFPINFANYLEVGFMDGMKYLRDKIQGGNKWTKK